MSRKKHRKLFTLIISAAVFLSAAVGSFALDPVISSEGEDNPTITSDDTEFTDTFTIEAIEVASDDSKNESAEVQTPNEDLSETPADIEESEDKTADQTAAEETETTEEKPDTPAQDEESNGIALTAVFRKSDEASDMFSMIFTSDEKLSGVVCLDGTLYDITERHLVPKVYTNNTDWIAELDGTVYRMHFVRATESSESTDKSEPMTWTVTWKLSPAESDGSEADPANTETVDHDSVALAFEDLYYVNGEECTSAKYSKVFKKNICHEEVTKSDKTEEIAPARGITYLSGYDASGTAKWTKDVYHQYRKTVTTKHKLWVLTEKADKAITAITGSEYRKASFAPLMAKQKSVGNTEVGLSWKTVPEAEEYLVYASKCGRGITDYRRVAETKGKGFTSVRKLKRGTYYKFIVVAVNNRGKIIAASPSVHVTTKGSCKNPRNLSVKRSLRIKRGKTAAIQPKVNYGGVNVHVGLRYESTDRKIATVTKSGKIKARRKGSCYVYVYAQNGICRKVKVTVK